MYRSFSECVYSKPTLTFSCWWLRVLSRYFCAGSTCLSVMLNTHWPSVCSALLKPSWQVMSRRFACLSNMHRDKRDQGNVAIDSDTCSYAKSYIAAHSARKVRCNLTFKTMFSTHVTLKPDATVVAVFCVFLCIWMYIYSVPAAASNSRGKRK